MGWNTPEWCNDADPAAPWNWPDAEPEEYTCVECGASVPEEHAEVSKKWSGDVYCDRCLVQNAESCGDWGGDSLAAAYRMGLHKNIIEQ